MKLEEADRIIRLLHLITQAYAREAVGENASWKRINELEEELRMSCENA